MRKTVIEWQEMSDSKEVYGRRPNPFISAFIYCLVGLLAAGVVYACFGKIDIVATTQGIVRPNEDVSTVASLISGRVTSSGYADGQIVREGDILLTVDVSDRELALEALEDSREEQTRQYELLDRFADGIEAKKNPFSSSTDSEEYPYYVKYRDYELSLKDAGDTIRFDAQKIQANIEASQAQIADAERQIRGLEAYRRSIQNGVDCTGYPEYQRLYELYLNSLNKLEQEYTAQKNAIQTDTTQERHKSEIAQYLALADEYGLLVRSLTEDADLFDKNDTGVCHSLYNGYAADVAQYTATYERAKAAVDHYESGDAEKAADELLSYDRTMLEGYTYYKQSVENGEDVFDPDSASVSYRGLYSSYKEKYDTLEEEDAQTYKEEALAGIQNTLLQISATIAEKEQGYGVSDLAASEAKARADMETAHSALTAYQAKKLAEYQQTEADYRAKAAELQATLSASTDIGTQLSELEAAFKKNKEQKRLQELTGIDSSLRSAETTLQTARSNLELYQISEKLYESNRDEKGVPLSLSLATVQKISAVLTQRDAAEKQLRELEVQIKQYQEQIRQGTITAECSGVVSASAVLTRGDMISAGEAIATVIPMNESQLKANLYVSNADIANIEVGDTVRYNLAAFPASQYGVVEGTVTKIYADVLTQNGEYSGYYLVESSIEKQQLTDKDGNTGEISIGMQLEGKIVTQRKTIIRYLWEKIAVD